MTPSVSKAVDIRDSGSSLSSDKLLAGHRRLPGQAMRTFDPIYRPVAKMVERNVREYQQHTKVVIDFIKAHGYDPEKKRTFEQDAFGVLNKRQGRVIPPEILLSLNAAIRGRTDVCDRFTVENIDPQQIHDSSDINHRVFAERLRSIRRIWFPDVARQKTPETSDLGMRTVPVLPEAKRPLNKLGQVLPARSFIRMGTDAAHEVVFDQPMQMIVKSGPEQRAFNITHGQLLLRPVPNGLVTASHLPLPLPEVSRSAGPTAQRQSQSKCGRGFAAVGRALTSLQSQIRGKQKSSDQTKQNNDQNFTSAGPPGRKKRNRLKAALLRRRADVQHDPDYIVISSDEEEASEDDTAASASLEIAESDYETASELPEQELPIRRSPRFGKPWLLHLSVDGQYVELHDSAAGQVHSYVEVGEATARLRELLQANQKVVGTTTRNGKKCELTSDGIQALAASRFQTGSWEQVSQVVRQWNTHQY